MQPKTTNEWLKELIGCWNDRNGTTFAEAMSLLKTFVSLDAIEFDQSFQSAADNSMIEFAAKSIDVFVDKTKKYIFPTIANTLAYNEDIEETTSAANSQQKKPQYALKEAFASIVVNNLSARKCAVTIIARGDDQHNFQLFPLMFQYYLTHIIDFVKLLKLVDHLEWLYPWLQTVLSELQRISLASDSCGRKHGDFRVEHPASQKLIESITDLYRLTQSDTRHGSAGKKLFAMLPAVNMLLRLYFRTSNIQLCAPVILSVMRCPLKDNFKPNDLNAFNFLAGKKAMFTGDIETAVSLLKEAFDACPTQHLANKRLILIYLIPIHMLLGVLPLESVLNEYSLEPFISLARSIKNGHLKLYHSTMETYKEFFVKHGIYVVLLKVEFLVFRSLLKYVFAYCESYNISIETVHNAYNLSYGRNVSRARFESMLSSLIYNGYIQGTILSEHQRLMVSKSKPFPKLSVQ